MRSPIKYMGNKGKLASKLLPLFPEHNHYIEVFGGGGGLLMAKTPSKNETYNDIDSTLYDFFMVLSDPEKFEQFYRIVIAYPYSRQFYKDCLKWQNEADLIKRISMWFVLQRENFGGNSSSWGMGVVESKGWEWLSVLEELPAMHKRLLPVQIENLDWSKILKLYDAKDTFFYLDPPYVPSTRRSGEYVHEMTCEDHENMVEQLLHIKGKAMLSGYPNDIYKRLEDKGWRRKDFAWCCFAMRRSKKTKEIQKRTECVWMNYFLPNLFEEAK